jgi:hypothetical protein
MTELEFLPAHSKSQAVARMYALGGVDQEPLGPGSKEKKSAIEALAQCVGVPTEHGLTKPELAECVAGVVGAAWDDECHSTGDTITLDGLNRLVDGVIRWMIGSGRATQTDLFERLSRVDRGGTVQEARMASNRDAEVPLDLEQSIAEWMAELSQPGETPIGVKRASIHFSPDDVEFASGSWRSWLTQVQDWLYLPEHLDQSSPDAFDRSLGASLTSHAENAFHRPLRLSEVLPLLATRLERAAQYRSDFLAELGDSADSGVGLEVASQRWVSAWGETEDEDEADVGGSISASADTWLIRDFVARADKNQLNLSPSYQRADVWPTADAQQLIESVVRGIPLPSIILLRRQDVSEKYYEVVDGKQRLTAILRFVGRHPEAVALVKRKAQEWGMPDLLTVFQTDYPRFKRLWKSRESMSLTSGVERDLYFPFRLRAGDVPALSGPLEPLRGRYYSEIRDHAISVAGELESVSAVFELSTEYKVPVILYNEVTNEQVHQVFSLYNKQGKHLNAEEIRNALFHTLDLQRALLVTSGDTTDIEAVAPFLEPYWSELASASRVLETCGFVTAGYKRSKILSWLASIAFFSDGGAYSSSTASRVNSLLSRVQSDSRDRLRDRETIAEAMLLLSHAVDAHALIPQGVWATAFKGSTKWQELQLVALLIGLVGARAVLEGELPQRVESRLHVLETRSRNWHRPLKTQTKAQWQYIAFVAREIFEILEVDPGEAHARLVGMYGDSGIQDLVNLPKEYA